MWHKYFNVINWLLWGFQTILGLAFLFGIVKYYFFDGTQFDLFTSIGFLIASYHFFWLKLKHIKEYVKHVTDFSKDGGFQNLNRRGRKRIAKYLGHMKKFDKPN